MLSDFCQGHALACLFYPLPKSDCFYNPFGAESCSFRSISMSESSNLSFLLYSPYFQKIYSCGTGNAQMPHCICLSDFNQHFKPVEITYRMEFHPPIFKDFYVLSYDRPTFRKFQHHTGHGECRLSLTA